MAAIVPKKIIYFTAGAVATTDEKAAIDKLMAVTGASFEVVVRNGAVPHQYGVGNKEAAAYAAGTIPTLYNALPVANPDAPPTPEVKATQKVISSGVGVPGVTLVGTAGAGKTMTLTIVAGVVTTATFA